MNQRGPYLSAAAPKRRESRNIISVGTRFAAPASVALKPGDLLQEQHEEEALERQPAVHQERLERWPPLKLRRANSSSGSIGAGVRRSYDDERARTGAKPPTSGTATLGSDQPRSGCSIRPNEIPASAERAEQRADEVEPRRAAASRAAGHVSAREREREQREREVEGEHPAPRGRCRRAGRRSAGRRGSRCRPRPSTSRSPRRARTPGRRSTMIASEAGVSSAPDDALERARARRATRSSARRAQNSDATPKPATPSVNTRRSP